MKKFISLLLCISVCLGLCFGCTRLTSDKESAFESVFESESVPEEKTGEVFTLRALYEAGKLSKEDLLNIAYYSNNARYNNELIGEDFTPTADNTLSPELENKLQETIANFYRTREIHPWKNASAERFKIEGYYGFYNGYHILKYDNGSDGFYQDSTVTLVEIGGVKFGFQLTYHATHIDCVSLEVTDNNVLEINEFVVPSVAFSETLKSFSEVLLYTDLNQSKQSYCFLNFEKLTNVSVKNQIYYAVYPIDPSTFVDCAEKFSRILGYFLSFEIEDVKLEQYGLHSIKIAVWSDIVTLSSLSTANFKYEKLKNVEYSLYNESGNLNFSYEIPKDCPQYNYVIHINSQSNKNWAGRTLMIFYESPTDIPLEYFKTLFSQETIMLIDL